MRMRAGAIFCIVVLLSLAAWASGPAYTVLYTFQGFSADGSGPWNVGTLLRDPSGIIYATTHDGGNNNCGGTTGGTLFKLKGKTETLLHDFGANQCDDGQVPAAAVISDSSGNLYGTTTGGGVVGVGSCGTVWEWETSTSTEIILHAFDCSEPGDPIPGVILDKNGNLYGSATYEGTFGYGGVYEISSAGAFSTLYAFTGGSDGARPTGGLVMDSEGNLYGTTANGGAYGYGTVFELSNSGGVWTETVLHSFNDNSTTDGSNPNFGNLTLAGNTLGNVIYGVTEWGGANSSGTVYEMVKTKSGTYKFNLVHSFSNTDGDGANPYGTLTLLKGKLYGTTSGGGSSGFGTVFELAPAKPNWTETILYNFTNKADGSDPIAGLAADSKGNLYGTAYSGGSFTNCDQGCGVIFRVRP
jgi:uncharacterized repeat protein (TIGR03803 family)